MRDFRIFVAVIVIISFSFLPTAFAQTELRGEKVPDFVTSTLDGKSFGLTDWLKSPDNKVLILTFFATWCELCEEDLKFFQKLHDRYADQGLRVYCVFTGGLSQIRAAKEYMEKLGIKLPVLMDKKRVVTKRYKVAGFPCTYAIDREGFLRFRWLGFSDDVKGKFESSLKDLLAVP
jgi:cytochrome c biogenesis protein CcmG/thiol:disulfide interchange protein DsbE